MKASLSSSRTQNIHTYMCGKRSKHIHYILRLKIYRLIYDEHMLKPSQ